jgi:hypothetical protein
MPSPSQIQALWTIVLKQCADSHATWVSVAEKCGRPGFFARVSACHGGNGSIR